jgi:hypothetical protein
LLKGIAVKSLQYARSCELHVHPLGCLTADDLIALGRDVYPDVDWSLFTDTYEQAYGTRPNAVALYQAALSNTREGLALFKRHVVYTEEDGGDFGRFQAKFNFLICLVRHRSPAKDLVTTSFQMAVDRHRQEGVTFVEYRCGGGPQTKEQFIDFHRKYAALLQKTSGESFTGRYIISLRRWDAEQDYLWVQELLDKSPDLVPTLVGIDFSHFEEGYPHKDKRALFERIQTANLERPERALEIVYHVGESYFDKSLESAIRWCHEAAEMGVKRLGHATALGLDPEVALSRRPDAHLVERVSERRDQIRYDLAHAPELSAGGVHIDPVALETELAALLDQSPDAYVERGYDRQRIHAIRSRQQVVLKRLADLGTVIETCPTSNLRIGGVPDPMHHPVHAFLKSDVNLVISADDPGIFDSPLSCEIDWLLTHSGWSESALEQRLGDPRRFQLGAQRLLGR